jgi:hypothetical protein
MKIKKLIIGARGVSVDKSNRPMPTVEKVTTPKKEGISPQKQPREATVSSSAASSRAPMRETKHSTLSSQDDAPCDRRKMLDIPSSGKVLPAAEKSIRGPASKETDDAEEINIFSQPYTYPEGIAAPRFPTEASKDPEFVAAMKSGYESWLRMDRSASRDAERQGLPKGHPLPEVRPHIGDRHLRQNIHFPF